MIDSSAPERFNEVSLQIEKMIESNNAKKRPILIVCTKQDKTDALNIEQIDSKIKFNHFNWQRPFKISMFNKNKQNNNKNHNFNNDIDDINRGNFQILKQQKLTKTHIHKTQ